MQNAFFNRLHDFIDLRHPLAILYQRVDWHKLHSQLAPLIARKPSLQKIVETNGLFGLQEFAPPHNPRNAGRPRIPLQTLIALLYLKHTYGLSDDEVITAWQRDVYFQYLSGIEIFQINPPCDKAQLSRFRKNIGEEGVEMLLSATIETAVSMGAIEPEDLQEVIIDTTVQEKAIAYPTDTRLLEVARHHLVKAAKQEGVQLKQTFAKEGKSSKYWAARYAHAKQFNRMNKEIKRQRTIVGILLREINRKCSNPSAHLQEVMRKAKQLKEQKKNTPNKLYAFHAPEVECISKGKARQPYEFGVKASVVTARQSTLILGARTYLGKPYDGHTLQEQLEQTTILLQDIRDKKGEAISIKKVIVDLGFRGVDGEVAPVEVIHRGKAKRLGEEYLPWIKRRQAIEPIIGHLKAEHGMRKNWLKGALGDALNAVLCAAGFNIKWLLRAIARWLLLCLFLVKASEIEGLSAKIKAIGRVAKILIKEISWAPQKISTPKIALNEPSW
jgi:IS5 family transposase